MYKILKMKQLLVLLFLFITITNNAKTFYNKATEPVLHYITRVPKIKIAKPPLILLLHGVGSNENDLFSFADKLPDNFLVISARAPITLSAGSYAWYQVDFATGKPVINKEQAEESRKAIIKFISQLKDLESFDANQVYLCGFSQGAIMSYSVGLTKPDIVKGIAILSGRLLDEVKPVAVTNAQLKHLNVFIAHGTNDEVLNIKYAKDANAYLLSKGIKATYKEYEEGHNINNKELNDLINWFKN